MWWGQIRLSPRPITVIPTAATASALVGVAGVADNILEFLDVFD